jgi:predicted Zn-dependent protease
MFMGHIKLILIVKVMMKYLIKLDMRFWVLLVSILTIGYSYPTLAQNVEQDKKLGAENAKLVESQMGLYQDKEMTEYIRSIGNRLVAELEKNPFEYQFHIADDPIPNAFALPGGYIYVTRGILYLITTEDELACVLGHEIIHSANRHSIKQMRKSILPHMLEVPGNIVGTVVSEDLGDLVNAPITVSNTLLLSSYSRGHEKESDAEGIELASKAGYDPTAMADILTRLSQAFELLTDETETKSYFSSHPYTPNRVNKILKVSEKLEWQEKLKISENFPFPLDGLLFGRNPAKGIFKGQVFLHPDLNFSFTFPEDWETSNQSTAVIGIHEDRKAGVFLGLEDPSLSPKEYAKKFEQEIEKEHGQKPTISEPRTVNGNPGYLITIEDNSEKEVMYIHMLWLKMGGHMFKLIGFGPRSLEPDLKKAAQSLKPLTSAQRNSIEVRKVRIVKPKKNETLAELSKRTNNVVKPIVTLLINGLEENSLLDDIQAVKIIIREKYKSK